VLQDDSLLGSTFSSTFTIGNKQMQAPLVTPDQLKGHLGLLRLFQGLREIVEAGEDDRLPAWSTQMERERRWAWFVALAVERFERWCKVVKYVPLSRFVEESLPPLDVMMVWHAYLLNPGYVIGLSPRIYRASLVHHIVGTRKTQPGNPFFDICHI